MANESNLQNFQGQSPNLENALPQTLADPKNLEIEKPKILKEKSDV